MSKYPDQVRAEGLRRYQSDEPADQIAADLGVSTGTLRYWARQTDLPRKKRGSPPNRLPDSVAAEAVRRYRAGETTALIAADLGVSDSHVVKLGERAGIYRRGQGVAVPQRENPGEVRDEALRRYRTREPMDEIEADLKVSAATMRRWARQERLPRKPRAVPRT